jgi:hypothetical protein
MVRHWFKHHGERRTSRASPNEVRLYPRTAGRVRSPGHVPNAAGPFRFADRRFSGFYAWLKESLSLRAQDDVRQTELIRRAWSDSGKVYGYPLAGR